MGKSSKSQFTELEPKPSIKFWSYSYKIESMITSLIEMLEFIQTMLIKIMLIKATFKNPREVTSVKNYVSKCIFYCCFLM